MAPRSIETLVAVSLVIWTLSSIIFSHATISLTPFITRRDPALICRSISIGCLIAVVACRSFKLAPAGVLWLFALLFTTITAWNTTKDLRILYFVLLLVSSYGMDTRRLLRFFVVAATAGFVLVMLMTVTGMEANKLVTTPDATVWTFGFGTSQTFGSLLFGLLMVCVLLFAQDRLRVPTMALCIVAAVVFALSTHSVLLVILSLAMAACVALDLRDESFWDNVSRRQVVRWVLAALPVVLLLLRLDSKKFYPFASQIAGAYTAFSSWFGFGVIVCLAVLYVRAILVGNFVGENRLMLPLFAIGALFLLYDGSTSYVECNGMLVMLSLGLGGMVFEPVEPMLAEGRSQS